MAGEGELGLREDAASSTASPAPLRSWAFVGNRVDGERAVISGPMAALVAAITTGTRDGDVRSFVREWRRWPTIAKAEDIRVAREPSESPCFVEFRDPARRLVRQNLRESECAEAHGR